MSAAHTRAGEALRAMLPAGADPAAAIEFACHLAFLVRDRVVVDDLIDAVKLHPDQATALIVTLAALVDIDRRPDDLLSWLSSQGSLEQATARAAGAVVEARQEYDEAAADTLPEVTLHSMVEMAHAAAVARVRTPCGTIGAYYRHIKNQTPVCLRCERAREIWKQATPGQREMMKRPKLRPPARPQPRPAAAPVVEPAPPLVCDSCQRRVPGEKLPPKTRPSCGKRSGYNMHTKHNEQPCPACSAANSEYRTRKYDEKLAAEGKTRVGRGWGRGKTRPRMVKTGRQLQAA